jgi:hypothetical protein
MRDHEQQAEIGQRQAEDQRALRHALGKHWRAILSMARQADLSRVDKGLGTSNGLSILVRL